MQNPNTWNLDDRYMDYMIVVWLLLALIILSITFQIVLRIVRKTVHFPAPAFFSLAINHDYSCLATASSGIITIELTLK